MQSHANLQRKLEESQQEQNFETENVTRLQHAVEVRERELKASIAERQQQTTEIESLRARLSSLDREYTRQLEERGRQLDELEWQLRMTTEQSDIVVTEKAERDVHLSALEEKAKSRLEESEKLRRRVHDLEKESAAKEVRLLEMERDRTRVVEDNTNLNIALDAKQQELELVSHPQSYRQLTKTIPTD